MFIVTSCIMFHIVLISCLFKWKKRNGKSNFSSYSTIGSSGLAYNHHYEHPEIKSILYTLVRVLLGTRWCLNVCQLSNTSLFKDSRRLRWYTLEFFVRRNWSQTQVRNAHLDVMLTEHYVCVFLRDLLPRSLRISWQAQFPRLKKYKSPLGCYG